MATAKRTRDHQKIRDWAESRHGRPAVVEGTEALLRIDFEEPEPDAKLKPIDWDGFFRVLDDKQLTFLFDPAPEGRMHKFIFADDKTRSQKAGKRSAVRPGAKAGRDAAKGAGKGAAKGAAKAGPKPAAKAKAGRKTSPKAAAPAPKAGPAAKKTSDRKAAGKTGPASRAKKPAAKPAAPRPARKSPAKR